MKDIGRVELIPPPARPVFEDFTVTALGPLRIQRDGDASELPFTPDSLVSEGSLTVGDRVRVELANGRLVVHGRQDGLPVQFPYTNLCINGTGRTNQRGYVSGTATAVGVYMVDRWKAAGAVNNGNFVSNPSAETATTGYTAVPGTTGVAACTSAAPATTTAYGTKVLKTTWSTASTAAGGGAYYEIDMAAAGLVVGDVISAGVYHVKSSINNRIRMLLQFRTNVGTVSTPTGTAFQVTAGTIYDAAGTSGLKLENRTIPATTTKIRIIIESVTGTGYANWSIASYLELDGLMVNKGATLLTYFDGATTDTSAYDYRWAGTADASVTTRSDMTTLTFVAAPQGQTMTINALGIVAQVVERANIAVGSYVLSWPGTSQGRIYKSGTTAPAWAASPIVVDLDGSGDVVMEFNVGTLSVGDVGVKLEVGSIATPFELPPLSVELAQCKWYFKQLVPAAANYYLGTGQAYSATGCFGMILFDGPMRVAPTVTYSNVTHFITAGATGSGVSFTVMGFTSITRDSMRFDLTTTAGWTAGQAIVLWSNNASATLTLDAEL